MEEMYQYTPVWEVANLVTNDPDPQIRMRALELLTYGDRQAAIDSLTHALNDPNPKIYELAEALLAELEQGPS
jgi:HEAT repeat protein